MNTSKNSFIWNEDFPPVYVHTSISFLKRCNGFDDAKKGDIRAAAAVTEVCIKQKLIIEMKVKYPDAVLIPIITDNKLPQALAAAIGLKTHLGVFKSNSVCRKKLGAMERLLKEPVFSGDISRGVKYIIVDDIVTQGGTISSLRRHILASGGSVAAVVSFACAAGGRTLAPTRQDICAIIKRFKLIPIIKVLEEYEIANSLFELTNSQIRYLLRFGTINSLEKKIIKVINN